MSLSPRAVAARLTLGVATAWLVMLLSLLAVRVFWLDRQLEAALDELETLRSEHLAHPQDDACVERIRNLDARLRAELLDRTVWIRRAAVWSALAAAIWALALRMQPGGGGRDTIPDPSGRPTSQALWRARLAVRRALAASLGLWVLAAALLAVTRSPLREPESAAVSLDPRTQWPRFRGFEGAGRYDGPPVATEWDGTTGRHIRWKTPVSWPGRSSPVVWGDRVLLSGGRDETLAVMAFDTETGQPLWTGEVPFNPDCRELDLEYTGLAANTLATDGQRAYAIFATGDIGAFDLETGRLLWHHALGRPDSVYGYASSVAVYHERVIVQFDQGEAEDDESFLLALDGRTGQTAWRTPRPVANSWTSPIVAHVAGRDQVLTVADPWTQGYDPVDGRELWRARCVRGDLAPSPIAFEGHVFVCEPYAKVAAIRCDGSGDVTADAITWVSEEGAPEITSPVMTDRGLCWVDGGEVVLLDPDDGRVVERFAVEGLFQASPAWANGRLYLLSEEGVTTVLEPDGDTWRPVARNPLGDDCYASAAFVAGRIYLRSESFLWCVEAPSSGGSMTP